MQPRSHAGGPLHTALSFMFHARKSQSPIFSETTRESASLRDQFCTTVLDSGSFPAKWAWYLSLCLVCAHFWSTVRPVGCPPPFLGGGTQNPHPSTHMLVPRGSHSRSCFTLMGAEMEMHSIAPGMAERRRSKTNTQNRAARAKDDFVMFFIQISNFPVPSTSKKARIDRAVAIMPAPHKYRKPAIYPIGKGGYTQKGLED